MTEALVQEIDQGLQPLLRLSPSLGEESGGFTTTNKYLADISRDIEGSNLKAKTFIASVHDNLHLKSYSQSKEIIESLLHGEYESPLLNAEENEALKQQLSVKYLFKLYKAHVDRINKLAQELGSHSFTEKSTNTKKLYKKENNDNSISHDTIPESTELSQQSSFGLTEASKVPQESLKSVSRVPQKPLQSSSISSTESSEKPKETLKSSKIQIMKKWQQLQQHLHLLIKIQTDSSELPQETLQTVASELPQQKLQTKDSEHPPETLQSEDSERTQETLQTEASELPQETLQTEDIFVQGFYKYDFPMEEESNSLPPFVVMTLELQEGNNEVECKIEAKNVNTLDTFTSIKFNINVEVEEEKETVSSEVPLETLQTDYSEIPQETLHSPINQTGFSKFSQETLQSIISQLLINQAELYEELEVPQEISQSIIDQTLQLVISQIESSKVPQEGFNMSQFPIKENSLPPFVFMELELQDGNNEVECKMLAKNINSSDTFASIKFNINVEIREEETTKESHRGGELQNAGEGVGGELQDGGEGVGGKLQDAAGVEGQLQDTGEGVGGQLQDGGELRDAGERVGGELQDAGEGGGGGGGELQTSENESSGVPHVIRQMESVELPHELLRELLQSSSCQADFSELPQETKEYAQETKEFVCQTDSSELRKSKMTSELVESLFSPFIEDIKTYKENSLPPFVVMKLELQDGNNEVECKMLAKNINSSDTFASIKFNIYVEVGEETTKESQGEGGGGESRTIGEGGGRESQTVRGKEGGRESQTEGVGRKSQTVGGKGRGRDSLTVGGEEIGRESETAGGERGRES
ncbi:putative leucine-rich repeat-containing protein DDB_G0290503 [Procambarus clarkii]|uniref:putative leucine-rich repeat-containing protein DDB_G0290503 n=1 Tax=Procambarus clarkii TaxID=6728 RepID=UPI003744B18E